jgi:prephenate dehydrogenase
MGVNYAVIGVGTMGGYTTRSVAPKADRITAYDISKTPQQIEALLPGINVQVTDSIEATVKDADMVLFAVDTPEVYGAMSAALPHCKEGVVISGQTSLKGPEAQAIDEFRAQNPGHVIEYASIHSNFNPDATNSPEEEILGIISHNSSDSVLQSVLDFYGHMSNHIEHFGSVDEHDSIMTETQLNTSRTYLSIASAFASVGRFPWLDTNYSNPIDTMKFALAMRAASAGAHVYRGIQFNNPLGPALVNQSTQVERELFRMIVGGRIFDYRDRVFEARERWKVNFPNGPVLTDDIMGKFREGESVLDNSHFSLIQYGVSVAESGKLPRDVVKGTTPMHTSLVLLTDRLFNSDELKQAIEAPFNHSTLREDDLVFHEHINGWSEAILLNSGEGYDRRHADMISRLDPEMMEDQRKKSRDVAAICRQAMRDAMSDGRFSFT